MRALIVLLLAGVALAGERGKVWVAPTYTEFFYAGARVREPGEAPGIAALRDAWAMLADEKRAKAANGGHLPAGYKVYRGGWWYEADGRGGDTFSEPLNGMAEAAALAWWHADQAKRKAARPANPTQPGGSPGQSTTRTTGVIGAAGPSTWSPGFYPAGSTFTPVRVGTRGATSAGCVSGYG